MKRLPVVLLIMFLTILCYGEEKDDFFLGLSTGYSWFHNYSGLSEEGMNASLLYEPAMSEHIHIDNAATFHFYWKNSVYKTLFRAREKDFYFMPQFTIGPRATVHFFDRLNLFFGGGLCFSVGVNYPVENEVRASFSPGFYLKTGFDTIVSKYFVLGLELKYAWSVVQIPHILTLNLRINFRCPSAQKN